MDARIRLKINGIELECEGTTEFIRSELPDLLKALTAAIALPSVNEPLSAQTSLNPTIKGETTNGIASKIGAKTAPDLFRAGLAYLQLVQGKEMATRQEILDQMKTVTRVYRKTMVGNLTKTISNLMTARAINEPRMGSYVLSESELIRISKELR
jgi:hypothetical protein